MGALVEDLGYTIHPHPTLSEILMESADASLRKAIHQVNRNR
jgi:dihydrolipoamide dehydrogenase